jgi:hypothetical protein
MLRLHQRFDAVICAYAVMRPISVPTLIGLPGVRGAQNAERICVLISSHYFVLAPWLSELA